MNLPRINYGDTLVVSCTYQDATGAPINMTAAEVTPSVTISEPNGMALVSESDVTVEIANQVSTPGVFTITSDTSQWDNTIGTWSLLIRYTNAAGLKWSADRIEFEVC